MNWAAPARAQARSMVVSKYGIVASSQPLASQAGASILEAGGNAVDAAIAANAVLGVTQPYANGIGGDLFAIVYEAEADRLHGLNSSGWTPKALSIGKLRTKSINAIDRIGAHAVTVPGCVAGWNVLRERLGTKTFSELLQPAIFYAQNGFPLPEWASLVWVSQPLMNQPGYAETYLPHGQYPGLGDTFANPRLAESLKLIATHGRDAFYCGAIAENLVTFLRGQGGEHTLQDFEEFEPEWVEPISTTYRGWRVFELPPNGQGIAALSMLNIMENFPLKDYGHNSANALHVMIEAKKLAYADMARYVGDPRFGPVPVEEMLSKHLAKERASLIDMNSARRDVLPSSIEQELAAHGHETIYLSTIDKKGNIVSLIQSNYEGHGTGMVAPGAGFSLHNRGAGFDLTPGRPNSLAGRKRPLHTIIPAFMRKGDVTIGFGIMGGWNQAQAHAQFVANLVDFEQNPQLALESPRFTKQTFDGVDVQLESRVPDAVRQDLAQRGHVVEPAGPFSFVMGNGEAVMRDARRGVNFGASDPRTDGAAIPEQPSTQV
jgi:gamma-glutamyltranspeptidase/glutathione hydrolase